MPPPMASSFPSPSSSPPLPFSSLRLKLIDANTTNHQKLHTNANTVPESATMTRPPRCSLMAAIATMRFAVANGMRDWTMQAG